MGGVEVIDRDPVETSAEVGLHLRHQPADIGLEVGIFRAILGRDDEAELMAVTIPALEECLVIGRIAVGGIQLATGPPAGAALPPDLPQAPAHRRPPLGPAPAPPRPPPH